jgi:hypothetical protein
MTTTINKHLVYRQIDVYLQPCYTARKTQRNILAPITPYLKEYYQYAA